MPEEKNKGLLGFTVAAATENDLEHIAALETYSGLDSRSATAYSQFLQSTSNILLIARPPESDNDRSIIGAFSGRVIVGELEVDDLVVAEEWRGRGVGGALLHDAIAIALEKGAEKAHLEVRASNISALRLYQKHGFIEVGRRKNYYRNPIDDAVLMTLDLIEKRTA